MRQTYLDFLRAIAVIWMIIFHVAYDMRMFHLNGIDFSTGFWFAFPRLIAGTFLFCVGISLNYTHAQGINQKAMWKRLKQLGVAAFLVSVGTLIVFPEQWVFFGTLHCILAGSLLGAFFVQRRSWAWVVMVILLVLQYGLNYDIKWVSAILKKPSMDFIPIYPWFWVILLGILTGPYLSRIEALKRLPSVKFFNFLGRHSLLIYLLHQPLIFGALYLLQFLRSR